MNVALATIGGIMVGLAGGWLFGRASAPKLSSEDRARATALEDERIRLAMALSDSETSLTDLGNAHEATVRTAAENRKLLRRLRDLEAALKHANQRADGPKEDLEVSLAMALRERDAAQAALMRLQGRKTASEVSQAPADPFDALPPLDDDGPHT